MMKRTYLLPGVFLAILLSGCSKEPPKCSDKQTLTIVRNIILKQIGGADGLSEQEVEENIKLEFPRADAYDEKVRKYSCDAKLIIANKWNLPIKYQSQLDDNKKHIVSVDGIMNIDLLRFAYALDEVKAKKAKAKK